MRSSNTALGEALSDGGRPPRRPARLPALTLGLLLLALTAGCSLPRFSATPRVGFLKLDGDVTLDTGSIKVSGSASDLDLDEREVVWLPRLDVDWDDFHVSAQAIWNDFSGSGNADVTAEVGGQPVNVNAPVRTDFKFGLYSAEVAYDVIPTDFIDVGLGFGVGAIDYDIEISSPVQNMSVRADDTLPFGYAMARIAKDLWRFRFLVNLRGLTLKFDGNELTYGDVDATVSFSLFGPDSRFDGRLVAGYRFIYLDYDYENGTDVNVDGVTLQGPFVGLSIAF